MPEGQWVRGKGLLPSYHWEGNRPEVLYHFTSAKALNKIMREGMLRPGRSIGIGLGMSRGVSFSTDPEYPYAPIWAGIPAVGPIGVLLLTWRAIRLEVPSEMVPDAVPMRYDYGMSSLLLLLGSPMSQWFLGRRERRYPTTARMEREFYSHDPVHLDMSRVQVTPVRVRMDWNARWGERPFIVTPIGE